MSKQIDKLSSDTGNKLYEASEALEALADQLNFGPDLSEKAIKKLDTLLQVKRLVQIAWELYPYPVEED